MIDLLLKPSTVKEIIERTDQCGEDARRANLVNEIKQQLYKKYDIEYDNGSVVSYAMEKNLVNAMVKEFIENSHHPFKEK